MENIELTLWIIGLALGLLEVGRRAYPDEKVKGWIAYIIDSLKFISDYFNRKTPY